jgi:hypothetical protein
MDYPKSDRFARLWLYLALAAVPVMPAAASLAQLTREGYAATRPIHGIPTSSPILRIKLLKTFNEVTGFNGKLVVKNTSKKAITLSLVQTVGLASSSLPGKLTVAANQTVTVDFQGSLRSLKPGYATIGVRYSVDNGTAANTWIPISIQGNTFRLLNIGDIQSRNLIELDKPQSKLFKPEEPDSRMETDEIIDESSKFSIHGVSLIYPHLDWIEKHVSRPLQNRSFASKAADGLKSAFLNLAQGLLGGPVFATHSRQDFVGNVRFKTINNDDPDLRLPVTTAKVRIVGKTDGCDSLFGRLAETITDGNGDFSVAFAVPHSGFRLCVILENEKGRLKGANGPRDLWGTWHWRREFNAIPPVSANRNILIRSHDGALDLWHEMQFAHRKMRHPSIRQPNVDVKFPSEVNDCPARPDPDEPWSCAGLDIVVAPDHATRFGTMTHELAHKYDGENSGRPLYIPTSHEFRGCAQENGYPIPQLVVEGYANFEMARVLSPGRRMGSVYSSGYRPDISGELIHGKDFENKNSANTPCERKNDSESVVSTVLWDFYDRNNSDSPSNDLDGVAFGASTSRPTRVSRIYLSNNFDNPRDLFAKLVSLCSSELKSKCRAIIRQNNGSTSN